MRSFLASLLLFSNTIITATLIYPIIIFKLIPIVSLQRLVSRILNCLGAMWIQGNYLIARYLYHIDFEIEGLDELTLSREKNYLLISNHQAYTDIFILQSIFRGKIPMPKFFLKQELIYFPIMGIVWWALDFPFVKRYSREAIRKNPNLAKKDMENIKNICEKYRQNPIAMINFVEGHRRTPARMKDTKGKHEFSYLLKPRSAGISVLLTTMQDMIEAVLDVTIVYPNDDAAFKSLISGKIRKIRIKVEFIPLDQVPVESDIQVAPLSKTMHKWLQQRWLIKDKHIGAILAKDARRTGLK